MTKETKAADGATAGVSDSTQLLATYLAHYYWHGNYGAYEEKYYVVTANTINEAMGLALEAEPDTKAAHWSITLLDVTKAGATYINERGS